MMQKTFVPSICCFSVLAALLLFAGSTAAQLIDPRLEPTPMPSPSPESMKRNADQHRINWCGKNERQIMLAMHKYMDAHQALPPLYTVDKDGKPLHSWRVLILPFFGGRVGEMAKKIRMDEPWDSAFNKKFHRSTLADFVYRCECLHAKPERVQPGDCNYAAVISKAMRPAKKEKEIIGGSIAEIADGTSNSLAIVEVKEPFCWMDPTKDVSLAELAKGINTKEGRVGSNHEPGGTVAALYDGSTHFFPTGTDPAVLKDFGDPEDGKATVMPKNVKTLK